MGLLSSVSKSLGSIGKVVAAPFTAGASLSGGSLSDILKGTISNTAAGLQLSGGNGSILGSILNGVVGLGGDYAQSILNLKNQKELAKYNAEQQSKLNQQAFDQNIKMWNMQNAYNTPLQQMKRLQAANLNPNLVYGSGNVTGNTAGSAPELQPAKFDTGPYHPVDTRMERAQLALAMSSQFQQIENQKIQNDLARQRLALAERSADRADQYLRLRSQNVNRGLTYKIESDKELKERQREYDREYQDAMREWRERETQHRKSQNLISKAVSDVVGDRWYQNNPQPTRKKVSRNANGFITYGHRVTDTPYDKFTRRFGKYFR